MSQRILLCAATAVEANACRTGVDGVKASHRFTVLRTGMGLRAGLALRRHLKAGLRPQLIVSTGFAGARASGARRGTWALGTRIEAENRAVIPLEDRLSPLIQAAGLDWHPGRFQTTEEVVLATTEINTAFVDMESYWLAEVAGGEGIPFQILRMVSDTREHPLPRAIPLLASPKLSRKARGLVQLVIQPGELTRFVAEARQFPRWLREGWAKLAEAMGSEDRLTTQ